MTSLIMIIKKIKSLQLRWRLALLAPRPGCCWWWQWTASPLHNNNYRPPLALSLVLLAPTGNVALITVGTAVAVVPHSLSSRPTPPRAALNCHVILAAVALVLVGANGHSPPSSRDPEGVKAQHSAPAVAPADSTSLLLLRVQKRQRSCH